MLCIFSIVVINVYIITNNAWRLRYTSVTLYFLSFPPFFLPDCIRVCSTFILPASPLEETRWSSSGLLGWRQSWMTWSRTISHWLTQSTWPRTGHSVMLLVTSGTLSDEVMMMSSVVKAMMDYHINDTGFVCHWVTDDVRSGCLLELSLIQKKLRIELWNSCHSFRWMWQCSVGVCGKPTIGSDLVFKKPSRPKIWHLLRRFFDRNCVQSTIQIKSDKLALSLLIKNILKHY